MKFQALSSLEPAPENNQDQAPLTNQGWLWPQKQPGSYRNMQFQMNSRRQNK